jgi:hypothetical protein
MDISHRSELLLALGGGAAPVARWRAEHPDEEFAVTGVDLSDLSLAGADLSHINLAECSLKRADLQESDLRFSKLDGTNLEAAKLRGANLAHASLRGALLHDVDLKDAILMGADLKDARVTYRTLSEAHMKGTTLFFSQCPICGARAEAEPLAYKPNRVDLFCEECGRYWLPWENLDGLLERLSFEKERWLLAAWLRNRREDDGAAFCLSLDTLSSLIATLPRYSVGEKQNLILKTIERKTDFPGHEVALSPHRDHLRNWCRNSDELSFHLNTLAARGLIGGDLSNFDCRVSLTADGFDYLERRDRSHTITRQVFVAMSFSHEMLDLYIKGIKPAIESAGYSAYRVDREPTHDRVDARLMNAIRDSRFMVADATGARPNVYFEAGFAYGLGKTVLWTVHQDDVASLPFDTRQYPHITWRSPDELRDELAELIRALIG